MVAVRAVLALRVARVEPEGVIARRVGRAEVSVVLPIPGRAIGLMAVTPVGLTQMVDQKAVLLVAVDRVALERAAMDLAVPEQYPVVLDVQVRPDQAHRVDRREARVAAGIDRSADVIAKTVAVARTVEMTRASRSAVASGAVMTADPGRETFVVVMATAGVGAFEMVKVGTGEDLVVHHVLSGRNGRAKIIGRHAKSAKPVNHETRLSVEQRR